MAKDGISEEQLGKAMEKYESKALIQQAQEEGKQFRNEVLDHRSFKQPIRDALLNIERERVWMTPKEYEELDEPQAVEVVRMPDGRWLPFHKVWNDDELKEELLDDALCNEKCVKHIIGHLNATVNKNMATSRLQTEDISVIGRDSEMTLMWMLKKNHEEYGIDPEDAEYIIQAVVRPNVKAVTGKAYNGGFLKQVLSSMKFIGKYSFDDEDGGAMDDIRNALK